MSEISTDAPNAPDLEVRSIVTYLNEKYDTIAVAIRSITLDIVCNKR